MLELRPNCELCDRDLPPTSADARICSYECTYCADCAETLRNVCPTCGGGFSARPIRPLKAWRPALNLGRGFHPPGTKRHHSRWSADEVQRFTAELAPIPPAER